MEKYYTKERNAQILIYLLKVHGIKKVIASPGTTNINFVASVQQDDFFQVYSSVDERSAAYMACGMAEESGEAVVITCTGATASRNYLSGLTEAYYRKLPVIAVTAMQDVSNIGHLIPQVIDRSSCLSDTVNMSVQLQNVVNGKDEWDCELKINKVLLALKHRGGGPVHINLTTSYNRDFTTRELPTARIIKRITSKDEKLPEINGSVAIFIGAHSKFSKEEEIAIEKFCSVHDAVVFCDHTSNYKGKYRVLYSLVASQKYSSLINDFDILIHIGEISGDYSMSGFIGKSKTIWRISEDGELRDTFKRLSYVFEMSALTFFSYYSNGLPQKDKKRLKYKAEYDSILASVPELPFSNVWIAHHSANSLPQNSVIHFGILNSLRAWNFFELPSTVYSNCNVGGFGIDGILSSAIGASLANSEKIFFAVVGDLAFFYDMNSLGNRFLQNNIRIMLINNGKGTEFTNFNHLGALFEEKANDYIAAAGHYGNKSSQLVKHYAEDLGIEYLSASNKEQYLINKKRFFQSEITERPMLFEIFTDSKDESNALEMVMNIIPKSKEQVLKETAKNLLGKDAIGKIKEIIKK